MLEKLHLYTRNYSLCSSILRKRITQSNSDTSNSTNHFYSFSVTLFPSICLRFFSLSVFFHCSYFSCLTLWLRLHCANVTNCQCVRFPFRGYAEALQQLCITLNIMHALFAFVQSIQSFHSSFHYFHFHIAHKSVHAHIVPYEFLFSTWLFSNLGLTISMLLSLSFHLPFSLHIVHGLASS